MKALGNILEVEFSKYASSIEMFDEFVNFGRKHEIEYDTLILKKVFLVGVNAGYWRIDLIIQRSSKDFAHLKSDLTYTKLKKEFGGNYFSEWHKNYYELIDSVYNAEKKLENEHAGTVYFDTPIKIHAASSYNRLGYGNEYCGEKLVHQGTLYGDTNPYIIIGVRFE